MIEIITGRERRRRWSVAEKLRIVAESQEPGVRVCDVAARHDVSPSLLHGWRHLARQGRLDSVTPSTSVRCGLAHPEGKVPTRNPPPPGPLVKGWRATEAFCRLGGKVWSPGETPR